MSRLAIDGGAPNVIGPLARFTTIGKEEAHAADLALHGGPLSGFLGGEKRGGYWVRRLEDRWAETFGVKHAIACNSATSGLLAACAAVGTPTGSIVATTPFTMSATAACAAHLGAQLRFVDVEAVTFMLPGYHDYADTGADTVIVTNLFGHPAPLRAMRAKADQHGYMMIEDNAQSPFAMIDGRYAGTIGHIGVFSLNVHKHIQCGEGGVCVTNNDALADAMRRFINHGEMAGNRPGLNLRMTEITAAIGLAQLRKGQGIVDVRVRLAQEIVAAIGSIPGLRPPVVLQGYKHVYYTIPFLIERNRSWFVQALIAEGVPLVERYVVPLNRLPAFRQEYNPACEVADQLHDESLFYYENCAHDPTFAQIRQIGDAFQKVAEHARQMA